MPPAPESQPPVIAMRKLPSGLIGILLAGTVAACLLSQQLYGQSPAGGNDPLARWRATSPGMSTNAALAFYRLGGASPASNSRHPRFQPSTTATSQPAYYPSSPRGTGLPATGYSPSASRQAVSKPFEGLQPAPTAFDRYWPLMLRGEQDPKSGFIYWSIQ
ncbi:hypothetical protein [Bythopirellula goksoeyrii]|uniref:hypothetical protein n=1 Tax=Bythopirellula goksoeyrii TaxID=1400387 RepID=UPI00143D0B3D|nr:hypothetical protein [Bythopirellula goksoeyrii]